MVIPHKWAITQHKCQTCAALRVLSRGDKLFVAYMDADKEREQDAEALLSLIAPRLNKFQSAKFNTL
ncbi:hypothetical protein CWB60_07670 [Pseudoalteromonas sp. S327]|nr:hypothetical protein CWB60_07670 [Pseudoalteromonas sp. S327]TMO14061.1 hypothetical protein CWB59_18655 [Pseudoalteromonas sp. S326]